MRGDYVVTQNMRKAPLWKKSRPLLTKLDIELTERCDNNCIHCYINLPADDLCAKKRELDTDEIKEILKEAASLGCMVVRFTGGEPFLRKDFEELYIFARRQGMKVMIFTNATLIDSRLAELFVRIPPLEKIEVTIYGMKKETYETVSGSGGSFERAWRGINLLLKNRVPFVVKGCMTALNASEIDGFEKWAATIPWMDGLPSYSLFFDLRGRRDGLKNEAIKKLRWAPEEGVKILARHNYKYLENMKKFCAKFTRPTGDNLFPCGAGCNSGCVDAYGNYQLCLMLRHPDTVYNLRTGSLKDAFEGFSPKVRGQKAANTDYINRCARCFLKGLCEQCPAKSWTEHGTLDTPVEYLCDVAHAQAVYLGLVKGSEKAWEVVDWKERIDSFVNS